MHPMDMKIVQVLAKESYANATRRDGSPVYDHAVRMSNVFARLDTAEMAAVALLHDITETTKVTIKDIHDACVTRPIMDSLMMYHQREDEHWLAYVNRISYDPVCSAIKIVDMLEDLQCLPTPLEVQQYTYAILVLQGWPIRNLFTDKIMNVLEIPMEQRIIVAEEENNDE